MLVPKSMRDIRSPGQKQETRPAPGRRMPNTTFVVNEVRSPQDVRIDRQLQSIFNRLNQSYSTSINTPHTAFLQQQLDDFLQLSQTVFLFSGHTPQPAVVSAAAETVEFSAAQNDLVRSDEAPLLPELS